MRNTKLILRHTASERVNHWLVAFAFILAGFSGIGFFHPLFYWATHLFGSGTWARILHPFFGSLMALCFFVWVARVWKDNRITAVDWQWAKHLGDILRNKTEHLPALGKYNLGQKLLTRTLVLAVLLLLASGVLMWQPWFAPEFSVELRRKAVVIHAFSAFVALACFIVHVYAAYWTRGAIQGMVRGTVTDAWAKHHHAGWYRAMLEKRR